MHAGNFVSFVVASCFRHVHLLMNLLLPESKTVRIHMRCVGIAGAFQGGVPHDSPVDKKAKSESVG